VRAADLVRRAACALAALLIGACAQTPPQEPPPSLAGTSWQFVRFQGGDGRLQVPDDRAKYTVAFAADGSVSVRFDCNRGRGSWKSERPGLLLFGPMAMTRAMCPPGSLHDQLVKHWFYVRSYLLKGGRLYLALMADGGIYEFEPLGR
jgi:para-nitrobenzyl esterase